MRPTLVKLTAILVASAILLSACQPSAVTAPASQTEAVTTEEAAPVTLRIALIPVLDALPMYVAQAEGLFAKHGVSVEFIPVKSAPERDQLVAAEGADGMVNEVLSAMFFNKEETNVQVIRYAQTATTEAALFRILAAPNSGIESAQDLKGVEIGISQGTVIEYLTDRLLEAEGLTEDEIKGIAVPDITSRMTLLNSGELKAAVLPEPLSSLAVSQGATVALDDTSHPEYSFSVITFRKAVIDEHPEAIRAFLAAIEEAVVQINQDPAALKGLLAEQNLVPVPIRETFVPNRFATAGIPTQAQWDDVQEWAMEKGLLDHEVSYEESVTGEYLP